MEQKWGKICPIGNRGVCAQQHGVYWLCFFKTGNVEIQSVFDTTGMTVLFSYAELSYVHFSLQMFVAGK